MPRVLLLVVLLAGVLLASQMPAYAAQDDPKNLSAALIDPGAPGELTLGPGTVVDSDPVGYFCGLSGVTPTSDDAQPL
jgi:hypothetical protein